MAERVCLIHWSEPEAARRAAELAAAGYEVERECRSDPGSLRALAEAPPAAIVLDLTRRPSQGRDTALFLRTRTGTRGIPLVVAGGSAEAVEGVRRHLPDAVFAPWEAIGPALRRAIEAPPADPVVPASVLAGYSGTPLPKKLGIKAGRTVAVVAGPERFEVTLGDLPEGARLRRGRATGADLVIWFVRSRRDLRRGLERYSQLTVPVWIVWPKQASGVVTDLTQNVVRDAGLASGLVDYKVCAVDDTWSGLLFRKRR